ncbi:hypothetical protein B0T10DRAFT_164056 [Thelonectria olida]|uniref:Uncharacterized protein n=1 Tax=Thelonectria olida TaxID=1576542 RepID=A0A9P8WEB1_9HYPO|nr:hypothetical protein B0T10DRAFT_164056 [Thelonectria olida]
MDPNSAPNESNGSHVGPDADVNPDDEQALMAQAMGFSAFGSQHPNKKRRYNPRADAGGFSLPLKPAGTGANSTTLGHGPLKGSNADEIALDDGGDDNVPAQATAQVRPASLPQRPAAPHGGFAAGQYQPQFQHHRPQNSPSLGIWYDGYYDPMSNENPWERIEKARGMSSVGSWLSRDRGDTRPSTGAPA